VTERARHPLAAHRSTSAWSRSPTRAIQLPRRSLPARGALCTVAVRGAPQDLAGGATARPPARATARAARPVDAALSRRRPRRGWRSSGPGPAFAFASKAQPDRPRGTVYPLRTPPRSRSVGNSDARQATPRRDRAVRSRRDAAARSTRLRGSSASAPRMSGWGGKNRR